MVNAMANKGHDVESNVLSREIVLDSIDFEINRIQSEQNRPGWTRWAILGSLATLVWLFLNELESKTITWLHVSLIFFVFSLLLDNILFFTALISPKSSNNQKLRFDFSHRHFGNNRMLMLLILFRIAIMLYIAWLFSGDVLKYQAVAAYVLYLIFFLIFLTIFVVSFLKLPILISGKGTVPKSSYFMLLTALGVGLIPLYAYGHAALEVSSISNYSNYKIAGLLLVASYVLMMLFGLFGGAGSSSPILSSLIEIRRDVALRRMDIESSIRQLDIAIAGMQVDEVLQEYVRVILQAFEEINQQYKKALKIVEAAEPYLPKEGSILAENERKLIEATIESYQPHIKEMDVPFNKIEEQLEKLRNRAKLLIMISPDTEDHILRIMDKIRLASLEFKKKFPEFDRKVNSLKHHLNAKG